MKNKETKMANILDTGKYRPKSDWIDRNFEDISCPEVTTSKDNGKMGKAKGTFKTSSPIATPSSPISIKKSSSPATTTATSFLFAKSPRRSSLAIGLFAGRGPSDKSSKRRSSIAVSFLGRRDNNKLSKDTNYENAVKSEKSDGSSPKTSELIFPSSLRSNNKYNNSNHRRILDSPNEEEEHNHHYHQEDDDKNGKFDFIAEVEGLLDNSSSCELSSSSTSITTAMMNSNNNKKMIDTNIVDEYLSDSNNKEENDDKEQQQEVQEQKQEKSRRRSSSWQIKFERRRRKNFEISQFNTATSSSVNNDENEHKKSEDVPCPVGNGDKSANDDVIYHRQKRHSWWNVFVPDQFKQRSRRASQDVGVMSRSADSISTTKRRSKSRSVDHGLAAPFDLDSLRSKVEGRFESIDRLSKDGEKKKTSLPSIPTTSYTVGARDTLTSVAARFDTTPSELTQLNRLASSFIYPGQQLLVPDKTAASADGSVTGDHSTSDGNKDDSSIASSSTVDEKSAIIGGFEKSTSLEKTTSGDNATNEKEILDSLRPGSPKPGHIERVGQSKTNDPADDPVITQRFLKINVRHITDGQGVVGGVLLVTPNAVMFDPNVSDPLVIEHGPESYGVIAPMDLVVNAAIFHDIAHMRVSGGESNNTEKVEIYYPKSSKKLQVGHSPERDSLLVKDETFPELGLGSAETCDDQESLSSNTERDGGAFPKAFDRGRVTPTNPGDLQQKEVADGDKKQTETKDSSKTEDSDRKEEIKIKDPLADIKRTEERRRSLLDQHWAIPSKERSSDEEGEENESITTADSGATAGTGSGARSIPDASNCQQETSNTTLGLLGTANAGKSPATVSTTNEDDSQLSKQSCYDSGIDIRDPNAIPVVKPMPTKKVFSDADIVLSSDWVPPRTISPTNVSESPPRSFGISNIDTTLSLQNSNVVGTGSRKKTSSVSFSVDDNDQSQSSQSSSDKASDQNKKNKMLKRLSYPLTWVEGLTGEGGSNNAKASDSIESAPNTGDSNQSVFSKVFSSSPITLVSELGGNLFLSKTPSEDSGGSPVPPVTPHSESHSVSGRSSIGTFMRPHSTEGTQSSSEKSRKIPQQKVDYRSMVSIDDMPELFVSFDKLIPRPARACPDPPLYLRLRMGRPIGKAIPLPTSVMSYGKNKLRPEYWFSVPKNRVDELYRFINTWVPHLYGELDEESIKARGYELIQHDTEWTKGSPSKDGRVATDDEDIAELTRESWEVLSMSTDEYRKASLFTTGSFDLEFPIPDLIGQTEILTEEHREKLCGHLPARAEGYSWSLVFSTSQHGFSINSLYRKMQRLESPILIVIEDTEHNVFGALTSCSLHVSEHFYGTGESLLFKFNPSFKVFHWTGENLYFIKGNPESLSIGAGDGKFGLWLDGDLNQGRTQTCSTYGNEALAPQEDFVVKTLECWAFV